VYQYWSKIQLHLFFAISQSLKIIALRRFIGELLICNCETKAQNLICHDDENMQNVLLRNSFALLSIILFAA
jgi:hypothetical protein